MSHERPQELVPLLTDLENPEVLDSRVLGGPGAFFYRVAAYSLLAGPGPTTSP